jgi:hypothetical protein
MGQLLFACVMGLVSFVCVTGQVLFACVMGLYYINDSVLFHIHQMPQILVQNIIEMTLVP